MDIEHLSIDNNTHPVIYVGGSFEPSWYANPFSVHIAGHISGASYPQPAIWSSVGPQDSNDHVHGDGPKLFWYQITDDYDSELDGKGIEIIKDPEYLGWSFFNDHPELSWFKSNIGFGEPNREPIKRDVGIIEGPYNNRGWRKIGENSGYESY